MSSNFNIVINHGTKGSPEIHWFPWLKTELEKLGCNVLVPEYPTPENQSLDSWLSVFDQEYGINNLDPKTILIGHSVSVAFVLRLLELAGQPVRASFLVAGFEGVIGIEEYDRLNQSYFVDPFDWAKIKNNTKNTFIYHGDNDPYVSLSMGQAVADNLGVELEVLHDAGHINSESGYTKFEKLLEDFISLSSS